MKSISVSFGIALIGLVDILSVNGQSIIEIVAGDSDLITLFSVIETAGYTELFDDTELFDEDDLELTLFAPDEDAFAALDPNLLSKLVTPPWLIHLRAVLSHHMIAGPLWSSNITNGLSRNSQVKKFTPLGFGPLTFTVNDAGVFVSGLAFSRSQLVDPDIIADNGVVHKVNKVLLPALMVETLWEGLTRIPGGFDVLKTVVESVEILHNIFDGSNPVTILLPPDAVIAKAIPNEEFAISKAASNDELALFNITALILNHILVGVYPTTLLTNGTKEVTTELGITYPVTFVNDTVFIGDVPITRSNILGSNGIAHMVGGLLVPPIPKTMSPTAGPTAGLPTPSQTGESASEPTSMAFAATVRLGITFVLGMALCGLLL